MATHPRCPDCGAAWQGNLTCQDHFHQCLSWESESPDQPRAVHHLLVLCYYLQHPQLYSAQGLEEAKQLLTAFVEQAARPGDVRQQQRATVDSGTRTWKIIGTPTSHGAYAHPIQWPIPIVDVTAGDLDGYLDRVRAWARATLEALKTTGNLTEPRNIHADKR